MGKIKKILENELVGGTQTTDVYPVTSVKAVYDENNERLDHILARRGVVNVSTNYNDDHIVEVLTLKQAIVKVPSSDRTLGFVMTFSTSDGWKIYQFNGDSLSDWENEDKWEAFVYDSNVQNLQYLIDRFYGSSVESGTNLLSAPSPGYVATDGSIVVYPNDTAYYYIYPAVPVLEGITYKYSGKISDNVVYAVAFYSSEGEIIGGLRRETLTNDYTEGTIEAPKGSVFAIVSTKDSYEATLSPLKSYYNNHTINVLAQINRLVNTKINKDYIINSYFPTKSCIEYNEIEKQKAILDLQFYATDSYAQGEDIKWKLVKAGYYSPGENISIQGYISKGDSSKQWTITFASYVYTAPTGIAMFEGRTSFTFGDDTIEIFAYLAIDFDLMGGWNDIDSVLHPINLTSLDYSKAVIADVRAARGDFNGREFKAGEDLLGFLTEHTYIQLSDGIVNYGGAWTYHHASSLIPVKGGEEYNYIGYVPDDNVAGIAFYTGSLKFIKGYGKADNIITNEVFKVTAPENAVYALVCCHTTNVANFRFYPTNSYYVLSRIKEIQDIQQDTQQDNYPYSDGVKNVIFSLPTSKMTSSNVTSELVSTGMAIEPNAIKITIGAPLPDYTVWNYYYAKRIGVFPAGKYVAFIRAKRVGTSACRLQVYSDAGVDYANKTITDMLTEEYQLFAVDCELTDESNSVNVGVSTKYSFNGVTEGDEIYLSLIGFAKNRTEKSIGSDIYTINDILELGKTNIDWNISYEASMAIFQGIPSIGMIGDSLMAGATYNHYDSSTPLKDRGGCEWWRVLARESGAKYLNLAKGGQHTRSWLGNFLNTATQEGNRCCAYIIGLGVNDAYTLGDSYLGSQSDIDLNNPDNNGDTYYGNYAKIIQKLKAFNSRAKFFLLTEPRKTGDSNDKWNDAIRYIANLFDNCYLVDLQNMYNNTYISGFIEDTKGPQGHYPYITYCYMAKLIERAIGKVIMDNAKDFVDIQFADET